MPRTTPKTGKIIFIAGPTSVGKTRTAVSLAKKINAEIISCDSMQVYKGMDILSSKPSVPLRKNIPHHLISILSPNSEYNVSRYSKEANKKIKDIFRKKKTPLIVGGTGLYISILLDGIFRLKTEDKRLRLRLEKEAQNRGSIYLHRRLEKCDPQAASKIHPNDARRTIRALEVFLTTGKTISELQKQRKGLARQYDVRIFCLNMERDKLYRRIGSRVDRMFKEGLVTEVKRLLKLRLSKTSQFAIGIREIKGYLGGLYGLEETKRLIKRNTCLYAKRQLTWFRKDKRIEWIDVGDKDTPAAVAGRILRKLD
jgi:tRNA dimethylallyltransferase